MQRDLLWEKEEEKTRWSDGVVSREASVSVESVKTDTVLQLFTWRKCAWVSSSSSFLLLMRPPLSLCASRHRALSVVRKKDARRKILEMKKNSTSTKKTWLQSLKMQSSIEVAHYLLLIDDTVTRLWLWLYCLLSNGLFVHAVFYRMIRQVGRKLERNEGRQRVTVPMSSESNHQTAADLLIIFILFFGC